MDSGYKLTHENPLERASILSKIFYTWIFKLCYKCLMIGLTIDDLYKPMDYERSERLADELQSNWETLLLESQHNETKRPRFLVAVLRTFGNDYFKQGVLLFVQFSIFSTLRPFIIYKLLNGFENSDGNIVGTYSAIGFLLLATFTIFLLDHNVSNNLLTIGLRARIAISSLINRKLLRLNKTAFEQTATGQIINLISNDVQRLQLCSKSMHFLWITPLQFVITIAAIWYKLGTYSAISIALSVIVLVPMFVYSGKTAKKYRMRMASSTDTRIKYLTEILDGIATIKLNGWEDVFVDKMKRTRVEEIESLKWTNRVRALILTSILSVERVLLCVGIVTYTYGYERISADVLFYFAQFCQICYLSISLYFVLGIFETSECLTTLNRIERFLLLDERIARTPSCNSDRFSLTKDQLPDDVPLNIEPGTFCAIVGPVGSGKTTLLHSLLNETDASTSGAIRASGKLSYASQEPWLFRASIKNNIVFGDDYDERSYETVLNVCDIDRDLRGLTRCNTFVGERSSVSLSGGQRARVNLARAVYRDADVYLLDDPLAALDARTAGVIFEKCFLGYLRAKTRVLVTNDVQVLRRVDRIVFVENHKVKAYGSYEDLNAIPAFRQFIADSEEKSNGKDDTLDESNASIKPPQSLKSDEERTNNCHETNRKNVAGTVRNLLEFYLFAGHWCKLLSLIMYHAFINVIIAMIDIVLVIWIDWGSSMQVRLHESNGTNVYEDQMETNAGPNLNRLIYDNVVYIYNGSIVFLIIITIKFTFLFFSINERASQRLHDEAVAGVVHAKMEFYNRNENGEIFNRFSKDLGCVDESLPRSVALTFQGILYVTMTILILTYSSLYMGLICTILVVTFISFQRCLIVVMQNLKELETATQTPLFTHVSAIVGGLITIRSHQKERKLAKEFDHHQDVNASSCLTLFHSHTCFGLWLDLMLLIILALICAISVQLQNDDALKTSTIGLIILRSLALIGILQNCMKECSEMVCHVISFHRVYEYTRIEREEKGSKCLRKNWPTNGDITFDKVNFQYAPNTSYLLKNINLKIKGGEKIAIIGRTGTGKTSLLKAFVRFYPTDGKIYIDGLDTSNISLFNLRQRITVVPQNPVLFTGTMRFNLDPLQRFTDSTIWRALDKVHMSRLIKTLDAEIDCGNSIFTPGQKQLLCIARAIIERNKILVLDEATANIYPRTDRLIRETINKEFAASTVISITHRMDMVKRFDKVLLLNDGTVVEYDCPHGLLNQSKGHLLHLLKETGTNVLKDSNQVPGKEHLFPLQLFHRAYHS